MSGIELKIERIKKGIKGIDLALEVGISPDKLSKIELERIKPGEELLDKIKIALGLPQKQINQLIITAEGGYAHDQNRHI